MPGHPSSAAPCADARRRRRPHHLIAAVAALAASLAVVPGLGAPATAAAESEHSLTTTFASTNGSAGSVFDLRVAPASGVVIDSLDVNLSTPDVNAPVQVYTRPGAAEANTASLDGWTLRGSASVRSAGYNSPTNVPISFYLPAGDWGVAVVLDPAQPRLASLSNTFSAPVTYSDDALALTTRGSWNHPAFSNPYYRNYQWNGTLHYSTAPATTIESGPEGLEGSSDAAFTYAALGAGAVTTECALAPIDEDYAPCPSGGTSYADLADGDYTFSVRAVDGDGRVETTPATRDFTVDTTAPDTTIDGGPVGTTGTDGVTFTYAGTPAEDTARYECRLSPATSFGDCPVEGQTYGDLADGSHTFEVRAVDAAGNADPTPATRTFTVDTTAPETTIDSGPDGATGEASPTFTYSGTPGTDVDHFECALTPATAFETCDDEGTSYADLPEGQHTFSVRAVDAAGNADPSPATRTFTVDTTAPGTTIDSGPDGTTGSRDVALTYSSAGTDVDHFECALSPATAFATCDDEGTSYTDLPEGQHTFSVRAVDAAGNADPTPATLTFLVNTAAPSIVADLTSDVAPRSGWYRAPVVVSFTCTDGGSPLVGSCPGAITRTSGAGDVVRTIQTADGDTATVSTTVRIDRRAPRVVLRGFEPSRVYTRRPAVRCVATDDRSGVRSCVVSTRLSDNRRRVEVTVRAVDLAGNVVLRTVSARYQPR